MDDKVKQLQKVVENLEDAVEYRIRAEERLKAEMKALKKIDCASIKEATKFLSKLDSKLERKINKFESDYAAFLDRFEDLLSNETHP